MCQKTQTQSSKKKIQWKTGEKHTAFPCYQHRPPAAAAATAPPTERYTRFDGTFEWKI